MLSQAGLGGMENHQVGNCTMGNCLPTLPKTNRYSAKIGAGLPSITGCSFNPRLTRCMVSRKGNQKPALANHSDTPTSYPLWGFVLKKKPCPKNN